MSRADYKSLITNSALKMEIFDKFKDKDIKY